MSLSFNSILRNAYKQYSQAVLEQESYDLTFVSVNQSLSARLGANCSVLKGKQRYYSKLALDQMASVLFMTKRDLYSSRCSAIVVDRAELASLQNSCGKRNVNLRFRVDAAGRLEAI